MAEEEIIITRVEVEEVITVQVDKEEKDRWKAHLIVTVNFLALADCHCKRMAIRWEIIESLWEVEVGPARETIMLARTVVMVEEL